jgi:hypothetical protein
MANPEWYETSEWLLETLFKPIDLSEKIYAFLATSPMAISTRNLVSVAIGEWWTIGLTRPIKTFQEWIDDFMEII